MTSEAVCGSGDDLGKSWAENSFPRGAPCSFATRTWSAVTRWMASLWFGFDLTQPFLTHSQWGSARIEQRRLPCAGRGGRRRPIAVLSGRASAPLDEVVWFERDGPPIRFPLVVILPGSRRTAGRLLASFRNGRNCSASEGFELQTPSEGGGDTTMDSAHPPG